MNENYVINLGRQLGSGGKEIGEKLAKEFGIAFYDKELINDRYKAKDICCEYNNLKPSDFEGKNKINILDMCNSFLY